MDVLAWSAWTGNVIALAGVAYTWWTNRGTRAAAAAAHEQAQKSLHAAEQAAAAQERMADALEKMYEAQEHHATAALRAEPIAAPAPWLVERTDDGDYRLTNAGPATLYDVHISASDAMTPPDPPLPDGESWVSGRSWQFRTLASWQAGTPQLEITWRDAPGGPVRRWERVIPG